MSKPPDGERRRPPTLDGLNPPEPYGGRPDPDYIRDLRAQMRHAARQASLASARWQKRDAELTALYPQPSVLFVAKRDDIELHDHYDTWSFFQREASRLAAAIAAELAALDLLGEKP